MRQTADSPRHDQPAAEVVQKTLHPLPEPVKGAVITVSDRCFNGEREDASGPLAAQLLARHDFVVDLVRLVPDGSEPVRAAIEVAVAAGARVVLTTGGTGVTPRDLTPEGTAPLLVARMEGREEQIRAHGWWASRAAETTAPSWSTRRDRAAGSRTPWPSSAPWCRMSWNSSAAATTEHASARGHSWALVGACEHC